MYVFRSKSSCPEVLCKKGALRNFARFTGKHLCWRLFLIKLQAEICNFVKKETLTLVFSCEFCEISKSTVFYRTPPVAASVWLTFNFFKNVICSARETNFLYSKIFLKGKNGSWFGVTLLTCSVKGLAVHVKCLNIMSILGIKEANFGSWISSTKVLIDSDLSFRSSRWRCSIKILFL